MANQDLLSLRYNYTRSWSFLRGNWTDVVHREALSNLDVTVLVAHLNLKLYWRWTSILFISSASRENIATLSSKLLSAFFGLNFLAFSTACLKRCTSGGGDFKMRMASRWSCTNLEIQFFFRSHSVKRSADFQSKTYYLADVIVSITSKTIPCFPKELSPIGIWGWLLVNILLYVCFTKRDAVSNHPLAG